MLENDFVNDITIFIHVGEAIFPEAPDTEENDSIIDGRADIEYFLILLAELDLLFVNQKHFNQRFIYNQ